MMFIDDRGYPGGPAAFFEDDFSIWVNTVSNAALLVNNLMVDSLVLWRCYHIWEHSKRAIFLPLLFLIASTGAPVSSNSCSC